MGLTRLFVDGPAHAVVQGLEADDGDQGRAEWGYFVRFWSRMRMRLT